MGIRLGQYRLTRTWRGSTLLPPQLLKVERQAPTSPRPAIRKEPTSADLGRTSPFGLATLVVLTGLGGRAQLPFSALLGWEAAPRPLRGRLLATAMPLRH